MTTGLWSYVVKIGRLNCKSFKKPLDLLKKTWYSCQAALCQPGTEGSVSHQQLASSLFSTAGPRCKNSPVMCFGAARLLGSDKDETVSLFPSHSSVFFFFFFKANDVILLLLWETASSPSTSSYCDTIAKAQNRTGNTRDDRSSPSSPTSTLVRLSYFGWCTETAAPCLETQTADTLNYPFCVGKTTPASYSPWCVWRWCKLTSWALTFLADSLFYLRLDSLLFFVLFF